MLTGEGSTAQAVPMGELVGLAPALQLARDHGHVRMAVGGLVGHDRPDDDQELARDRRNGFYTFLAHFFGLGFTLQVSEVHLCADLAGWELAVEDSPSFIPRGHNRAGHALGTDEEEAATDETTSEGVPSCAFHLRGRRCTGFEFSRGGAHSCRSYDKTKELAVSHKDWMQAIWEQNGWDGTSRVVRVEFVYKRECLREVDVEEPYAMLDQLPGMWAYSTQQWLRHTVPTSDTNRGRWEASPFW